MLGAIFGALKGALLVTAAVLVIQLVLSRSGEPFKTESRLVPHFQIIALWMLKTLDQETDLNFDNIIGRIGQIIDSGVEEIELDDWKKKLGLTADEIATILEDDEKLNQLRELVNDPEALEKLKSSVTVKSE